MLLCIINVHSRSNDHEFNHCCQGLVRQLNHSYFTKIGYFQGSNSLHYKSASEVTTLRRHTNLFIIIIIKKIPRLFQDCRKPAMLKYREEHQPGLSRTKPVFQTQFLDFPGGVGTLIWKAQLKIFWRGHMSPPHTPHSVVKVTRPPPLFGISTLKAPPMRISGCATVQNIYKTFGVRQESRS